MIALTKLLCWLTVFSICWERGTCFLANPHRKSSHRTNGNWVPRASLVLWSSSQSGTDDGSTKDPTTRLPSVIIFDLDGCLWRPEMYELLYFSGGAGAPFTKSPDYDTDGTLLTTKGEPVRLLGQVRQVMQELYSNPKWKNTQVGISSRTDQPDWARELLQKFTIETTTTTNNDKGSYFAMEQVFQKGPIEIQSDSKVRHFERIAAQTGVPMSDILFFDNERGNCREVAKLGVVVGYAPDGVTQQIWDASLQAFPDASGKVVGIDIYSYDSLEGANLFYDGEDYKKTEW
ncbi:Magnesium-dependent phosphatase 1 [Seminavis robusta]|uniref:Magnesium-dependent phosphatase 1 n=1 Tax=Seminavis robusta TaxID=568900 RepID=A0A9N8HM59_9STRA|nr:Magnesium-dependent phosphatase 1 [Seminavis robusta]|eukprot:Sro880_g215060.1 Magnesium-dependent phosphatase 1 (289) ;mRNA; f:26559-27425